MKPPRTNVFGILVLPLMLATLIACSGSRPVELPPQSLNEAVTRDFGSDELQDDLEAGDPVGEASENVVEDQEEFSENNKKYESRISVNEVASAAPDRGLTGDASRSDDGSLVIIGEDDHDDPEEANPLLAASLAERRRRQTAPAAVAVITDKNLAEYAEGGHLTFAEAQGQAVADARDTTGELARADEELYWRTRVRSLRAEWRRNAEQVVELEQQAEGLRRDFYSEDDPYVRDRRIKPEWDRTLDRLDEARRGVERNRQDLATALEEGRRAGALPGWLRDGVELEPEAITEEETPELDPEEPTVIDP